MEISVVDQVDSVVRNNNNISENITKDDLYSGKTNTIHTLI